VKLYKSKELPGQWIGEDKHGVLMKWPAEPGGWMKCTPYTGGRRQLEVAKPALARGTRWPGAGRAPRPRATSGEASTRQLAVRATPEEFAAWERRASEEAKLTSVWARDELNAVVARPRSKGKP
jgi:hypothetical protein